MLRSIGIGCCFAVLAAMFVSLTATPLMLFVFFDFFRRPTKCDCLSAGAEDVLTPALTRKELYAMKYECMLKSVWYRISVITTEKPLLIFFLVIGAGVPLFIMVPKLEVCFDLFQQVPRNAEHLPAFKGIMDNFGSGQTSPYYFPIDSGVQDGVCNDSFFEAMHDVIHTLSSVSGQPPELFQSIAIIPNPLAGGNLTKITWSGKGDPLGVGASQLLNHSSPFYNVEYEALWNLAVTRNNQASLIQLFTTFAPLGIDAKPFCDHMVPYVQTNMQNDTRYVYLGMAGGGSDQWAVMDEVMHWFPYQIISTFAVVFIFIAAAFRSIAVPIRMLFTVGYTVAFTFGAAVIIFQYTWLHGVWTALHGVHALFWLVPVMTFNVICSLALDYDVFLLTRVIEYRRKGFTEVAALRKAVWKTGRIISFAGIIMLVAFFSLVLSGIMVMNQSGCMLGLAIILDTFVIRTVLMPALMSLFPSYAFWPARMPLGYRDLEDMGEDAARVQRSGRYV